MCNVVACILHWLQKRSCYRSYAINYWSISLRFVWTWGWMLQLAYVYTMNCKHLAFGRLSQKLCSPRKDLRNVLPSLNIIYNPHRAFFVWVLVEQSFCEKPRHSTKKLDLITELLIINVLPKAHRNAWVRPQNLSQMEFTNSNNLLLWNSTSDNLITYVNKTCAIMHTTNDSIEF